MHSHVPYRPLDIEFLERFHGHVGPFVAIGSRMGDYAVTEYGMPRYFGVTVEVECPSIPPHSCLIDGLMVATGATFGKKNIKHAVADKIRVRISNDDTGAEAVFTIKPTMLAQLKKWVDDDVPVEERGQITFNMKPTDLFDVVYTPGKEAK